MDRRFLTLCSVVLLTYVLSALAQSEARPTLSTGSALVVAARAQVGVTRRYDPAYVRMAYPGGDVAIDRGVCTDVVIRAFRKLSIDQQRELHEDMRTHFSLYPQTWGLRGPDRNIDHRRVPNLRRWFERQGWQRPVSAMPAAYRAGDLVTWDLGGGVPHIGIVSDRKVAAARPLIIHNIGRGTQEEDILPSYRITGHYRPVFSGSQRPLRR